MPCDRNEAGSHHRTVEPREKVAVDGGNNMRPNSAILAIATYDVQLETTPSAGLQRRR